jgi:1-acyl-sn-glycerol-3-phosphate acyltransferase/nucleoside-diphosphate-sugar epimerase
MARVIVIDDRDEISELVVKSLNESALVEVCLRAPRQDDGYAGHLSGGYAGLLKEHAIDTVIYSPALSGRTGVTPDLEDAESVFQECSRMPIKKFILLSSAMIYGASPHNPGFISESRMILRTDKPIVRSWIDLEALAVAYMGQLSGQGIELSILRPAAVLVTGGNDYFSRLFRSRIAVVLPGHDPTIQLLSPVDLARAVRCTLEQERGGVFNIAPKGVITLRAGLKLSEAKRLPASRLLQRIVRSALTPWGLAHPIDQLEYIRYSWTISNRKITRDLGWTPQRSSVEALRDFRISETGYLRSDRVPSLEFDDFGMDPHYISTFGRRLFRFLHDRYWRVEIQGLNHVPRSGRAVLVGVHRGFMPWDAVMMLHLVASNFRRYIRFLIHPGLIKFPFLFNFHTKLGGIIACQENADYVLSHDEMVGIFPEGIRGAFRLYRDAYQLGKFGRDEFVKLALRHQAPIIPFVTVGSAEIFPILKRFEWGWWRRHTEWPFFPLTPTWPLLPVPLPSKWHTQFLEPVHIENRYPPEAADDPAIVQAISHDVRWRMQEAINNMLRSRKSIFYGSIFKGLPSYEGQLSGTLSYEEEIIYKEKLS